jgi:hypothetical protein
VIAIPGREQFAREHGGGREPVPPAIIPTQDRKDQKKNQGYSADHSIHLFTKAPIVSLDSFTL